MRKMMFVFSAAALVAFGLLAQGPRNQAGMGRGMGFMGGMMSDPIHQSVMTAFLLPEMQSELGLSAQQTTQLKQAKQELLTKGQESANQIAAKQKELEGLVAGGTSRNMEVKRLLEQVANLRAQQEFAAYEATGKMKAVLTDSQKTKLAGMKPYELHQAMMSRMTVGDMTQMMQFMGGDAGMMGRGMMGFMGGMMGSGGMMGYGGPPKQ
jgi:Spy/CpxP family protein refolding chaperone